MACDCIEKYNRHYAKYNAMVKTAWAMRRDQDFEEGHAEVAIFVVKADETRPYTTKSKSRPTIMCEFCPFCGVRYMEPTTGKTEPDTSAEPATATAAPSLFDAQEAGTR